jgi:hypothetical protein
VKKAKGKSKKAKEKAGNPSFAFYLFTFDFFTFWLPPLSQSAKQPPRARLLQGGQRPQL